MKVPEKLQVSFFKGLFHLPLNTPNHFIRSKDIRVVILERTLNWWIKVLAMSSSELPKICLFEVYKQDNTIQKHWFSYLAKVLHTIGYYDVRFSSSDLLRQCKKDILEKWSNHLKSLDLERVYNSKYNPDFRFFVQTDCVPFYFIGNSNIKQQRLLIQLRLSNINLIRIYLNGEQYVIDTTINCQTCNLNAKETLAHILKYCPSYNNYRKSLFKNINVINSDVADILDVANCQQLNNVYNYFLSVLKFRKFVFTCFDW